MSVGKIKLSCLELKNPILISLYIEKHMILQKLPRAYIDTLYQQPQGKIGAPMQFPFLLWRMVFFPKLIDQVFP